MNIKKLQSGRSMVEMLGVLAVIGVLLIGGISGYTLSMRRHRANGIADIATKYSLIMYSYCQNLVANEEVDSVAECIGKQLAPSFENTDIGGLPAGVLKFSTPISAPNSQSDDYLFFSAYFDDDQLCQAVGAVTGTGCSNKSAGFKFDYK